MTKQEREKLSKSRQHISKQLAIWNESIKRIESKHRVSPDPKDLEALSFCRIEKEKCVTLMKELNKGQHKQRAWVSDGCKY